MESVLSNISSLFSPEKIASYAPILVIGILGLIIGSFLNVLILRYNTGKGFGGRSMCFSCMRQLTSIDLVPVLSYLGFKGRCRTCKSKISPQYVLVELFTALFFILAYLHNIVLFGISGSDFAGVSAGGSFSIIFIIKLACDLSIMSLLVAMVAYDIRHKIIPDIAVILFGILALISQLVIGNISWQLFFAGIILALPFYLIWLLSQGRWMGLGDAKLVVGFGWMLGLSAGATAIVFGFWFGAIISVGLIAIQRITNIDKIRRLTRNLRIPRLNMKSEVPFAPFLIAGLLIVYVLGYNLFTFSL